MPLSAKSAESNGNAVLPKPGSSELIELTPTDLGDLNIRPQDSAAEEDLLSELFAPASDRSKNEPSAADSSRPLQKPRSTL
ncbi:MAG: hypothetical protein AAFO84_11830 [Cyanobacteria bacterium J06598_1]